MISPHSVRMIALFLFSGAVVLHGGSPDEAERIGWVPRELLERPVPLRTDIGRVHEQVTTSSSDAQAFYDQGLAYLHSYVWIEAARSFNQALRFDARLAMAHLGLSYVCSGLEDDAAARAALERAQSLAGNVSDREGSRLRIRARQVEAIADPANLAKREEYRTTVDSALATWPDDPEFWILAGQASEASPWGRGQRGTAVSIGFYEAALRRAPDHLAAHHYLTHTYEMIGLPDRALPHGQAHARLAPGVPHAQHMYGHDLRRVGRIDEAVAHFEHTRALEEAYFAAEGIPPEYDWHHAHNLSLLASAYQYQGRLAEARELHRRVFLLPKFSAYFDLWRREYVEFLLGRRQASEALAAAREMQRTDWPAVQAVAHALAGRAHLAMGRSADAEAELAEADHAVERTVGRGPLPVTPAMLRPAVDTLRGELSLRAGRTAEARPILADVQTRVRSAPGADAWIDALFRLESIALTAREAGDWQLAEQAARQMIEHDVSYAGAHYALALVLEQQKQVSAAKTELRSAVALWSRADADLPELVDARRRLTSLAQPESPERQPQR